MEYKKVSISVEVYDAAELLRAELGYKSVPQLLNVLVQDKARRVQKLLKRLP